MKTKIVLWGENEKDEKILLGIELVDAENVIRIHTIPEADATEIFYNQMMNQWRDGANVVMPENTITTDRALSMSEGLLPDNIKTQRQDILARAKTEWHFIILSSKLYEAYADEVSEIKERIEELTDFDGGMWEEMKAFWKKVQDQVQEKNLFREHAAELRAKTNELFDALKSLKRSMNDEFEKASKVQLDIFIKRLTDIEERIEKGLGLQPIFNELKDIQNKFKDVKFTRKHHNDLWNRIDGAFKKVKGKKYGDNQSGRSTAVNRLTRRMEGLMSAIDRMQQSIDRDGRDKNFQEKRINKTDGQLELQIRQAKMAMIIERINSKQLKLDDMLKTKTELEQKLEAETIRSATREEKRVQAKQVKQAKKTIKEDIAKEIESKSDALKTSEEKLEKAAKAIKESKVLPKKKIPPIPVITKEDEAQKDSVIVEQVDISVVEEVKVKEEKKEVEKTEEVVVEKTEKKEDPIAKSDSTLQSKEDKSEEGTDINERPDVAVASPGNKSEKPKDPEIKSEIGAEIEALATGDDEEE